MVGTARGLLVALATFTFAGCVGATPRDEFNAEIRARGGGLTAAFVTDSLDVVAVEFGAGGWSDLDALSLSAQPADRSVSVVLRQPSRPDFVDTITVLDGRIVGAVPMRDADELPLDGLVISLDTVALDRIDEIAATALGAFGEEGGYVTGIRVTRAGPDVQISIDVESERRTATVNFDPDGTLRGVE